MHLWEDWERHHTLCEIARGGVWFPGDPPEDRGFQDVDPRRLRQRDAETEDALLLNFLDEVDRGWAILIHRGSDRFRQLVESGAVIAPSGLVPKEGTRGRSIVDHHIVNEWWEKGQYREVYGETPSPLVEDIISIIGWMGLSEDLVIAKVDVANAYKNVRISPSIAHLFCLDLGVEFVGIPLVMTFGSRLAPIAFGVITSGVIWALVNFPRMVWEDFGLGGNFDTASFARLHFEPPSSNVWWQCFGDLFPHLYQSGLSEVEMAGFCHPRSCWKDLLAWNEDWMDVSREGDVFVTMYVDDIIIIGRGEMCEIVYKRAQLVVELLMGKAAINKKKLVDPCRALVVLGWEIDLDREQARIAEKSRAKMAKLINDDDWLEGVVSVKMVESLFGMLQHAAQGRSQYKAHVVMVRDALRKFRGKSRFHKANVALELGSVVQCWRRLLSGDGEELYSKLSSMTWFPLKDVGLVIMSDAALGGGGGVIWDRELDRTKHVRYPHNDEVLRLVYQHVGISSYGDGAINYLEALAVVLLLEVADTWLQGKRVLIFVDNTVVLSWIGWRKVPPSTATWFALELARITDRWECCLDRGWVPTDLNVTADALSRNSYVFGDEQVIDPLACCYRLFSTAR